MLRSGAQSWTASPTFFVATRSARVFLETRANAERGVGASLCLLDPVEENFCGCHWAII